MPIIIDPATGARRFVADNSGFNAAPLLAKTPATTEAGEFAKGLRSGIEQVTGLGNSALAAGAAVVGQDEFSEEQTRQANENFRRSGEIGPRVTDFNTATESTENFTDFLKGGIGQAVPTMLTAIGGGVAGLGVKSLLKSGVSKTVAGGGGAFAATEGLEAGGIFSGLVNDPVARENKTLGELAGISFAGGAPAAALDTLPLMRAARKFGLGLSARREITSKMKEFGKGVSSQALIEGSTEGAQTVIERATHNFVNKHFEILGEEGINEILGAATIGTAFGGITGGAAVTPSIIGSRMAELDRETQDGISQAEATFDKLRKVDDEGVQEHLDYLQDFNIEDTEVQEDLDTMLKDLNLRRPKFSRAIDGPTAITPDTTKLNRRTVPPIKDQSANIAASLGAVDRGLARRRTNTRKELKLRKEKVYTKTGGLVRVGKERKDLYKGSRDELSQEELSELTVKDTDPYSTDRENIIGDEGANVAFSTNYDQTTGEVKIDKATGKKQTAEFYADRDIAKLQKDNPGYAYEQTDAFEVFSERARQLESTGELDGTRDEEIIRLAQDDDLRMRTKSTAKQVGPENLDTIKKVKKHFQGRKLILRERIPAALSRDTSKDTRSHPTNLADKEALTGSEIKNIAPPTRIEARARARADISTRKAKALASGTGIKELQAELIEVTKIEKALEVHGAKPSQEAINIAKGQGVQFTQDAKKNRILLKNAVYDQRFALDKFIKESEIGIGVDQGKLLDKDLDKRQSDTVLRSASDLSQEGKKFFKDLITPEKALKKPLTVKDYTALRAADPTSRYMVFGKNAETDALVAIRPHAIIQKKFQKIFGGQGRSYDKQTIQTAWMSGIADLIIDHDIVLDAKSMTNDVIVFTDASKRPWTVGELGSISTSRSLKQASKSVQILINRLENDKRSKPEKVEVLKVRLLEITRSQALADRIEREARAEINKFIRTNAQLQKLANKKEGLGAAVQRFKGAVDKLVTGSLSKDYLDQRVHTALLQSHKEAEAAQIQSQFLQAQNMEVAKLQDIFNRGALFNEDEFGPIPIEEFTKLVAETQKENETRIETLDKEVARLDDSNQRFGFVMETTSNDPSISMPAAEAQYDMQMANQQSLVEDAVADQKILVSIVSRYKKEMARLETSSKLRLRTINDQIKQHQKFLAEHEMTFKDHEKVIRNYVMATAELRALDEEISTKNTSYEFSLKALRAIEAIEEGGPDLSITNMLNDISPKLFKRKDRKQWLARRKDQKSPKQIVEIGVDPDEFNLRAKSAMEELMGFARGEEMSHFSNAAETSAYSQIQNEIIEIDAMLAEAELMTEEQFGVKHGHFFRREQLEAQRTQRVADLKTFYLNRPSEPRPTTLDETTEKYQDDKTRRDQGSAQRNVLKPIVTAVKQIAGRIKTTAGVLSTEQAMAAWNMTRQQLLETNGMYFKGQIWVKETLSPTVMREVIAHELGHGIFENELRTAGVTIQNNIRKEFDAWRESVRGKSVHTVIQSKAAFATARKYITESKDRAVSSLSAEDQAYLLDFEEWFADQVAVYEGTKPTTLIGKFFAKIGNLIKKLMGRQTQSSVREFLDGIEQRNWIPSAISRGKRFFEYAKASKPITDDTLMSHLMKSAGNSMSDIETLSQMLPKIFTKADLSLLGRAFTQGNVRSQLFRLYPDAAKVALDESVSRTVAAGLIQWSHGELQVGPKVHSVYEKMAGKLATALNGKTDMQKQNAALDAIKQGKAVWGHITDLKLTRERTDAKRFKDVESIADFMSSIGDVFEKVFISANDRLYGTKNPALIKLAQMFHSRTGTRLIKQGYFQEKQRNVGRYLSSASNVLKPLSDEQKTQVLADLRSGNHSSNAAAGMRKIFNAMYAYATQNGVEIELRKNYVPRVWNKEEVAKRRPELEALLGQHGIKQPAKAVDKLLGMEEREIEEWLIEYNPTAPQAKQRTLGQVPDQVLADANFLSNDLEYLTVNYIEALVKKVEYTKRFGEGNEKIIEITKDAEKLGATNDDIELMHSYIQAMMGITGHETNAALAKMLGLKEPPVGQKINPVIQQALSTVLVVRNLALLSLAMFTSLADPLGISVRSGSLTDTGVALKTGLSEIWNSVTGQQSEVHELANALGILESHMTNVALQWEYGGTYMAPWARKVNDEFFKWTGLTGLTRLTRSMALGASHSFIARHASNPNESSLRYLEELNLTPEEVWLTPDGKSVRILTFQERSQAAQHERDRDDKVRAAMNQFVDEAILRPNAAQRPIWASDPHYMLVFHLKAFMYSFHDRILRRAVTEMGAHNSVAPMVGLMMFIPALLFIDSLRDLIKHGGTPSYKKNWDITDYAFNSMERAGLFGIYQQGFDIRQAQQYGGSGAEALLGGVMFPFQLFTDPTELLPFQNLSTK